jgi:hypothetical protein
LYQQQLDRNFDKYELYLFQYIFPVPAEVICSALPAPAAPQRVYTAEDEAVVDRELQSLRTRIRTVCSPHLFCR